MMTFYKSVKNTSPALFKICGLIVLQLMFSPSLYPAEQNNRLVENKEAVTISRAIGDLKSNDAEIRKGAVMLLAKYNSPQAQKAVIDSLKDKDKVVRHAAVVSVVEWRTASPYKPMEQVLDLIDDPFVDTRRAVSSAVAKLIQTQRSRKVVFGALSRSQGARFSSETIRKLSLAFLDKDVIVRRNMLNHYKYLGFRMKPEVFAFLLEDIDWQVRLAALPIASQQLALALFLDKAVNLVSDDKRIIRLNLARELSNKRNNATAPLLNQLANDDDAEVSTEARIGLFQINPTEEVYRGLLTDYRQAVLKQGQMTRVIQMLPYLGERAQSIALEMVDIEDAVLRLAILRQCISLRVDLSKPEVIAKFMNDDSMNIRNEAIRYYQRNRDKVSAAMLDEWLKSKYKEVKVAVVTHCVRLPSSEASDYLFELIIDDELSIRTHALRQYVQRRLSDYKKILLMSLQDEDIGLQKLSVQLILQHLGKEGADELLDYTNKNIGTPLSSYILQILKSRGHRKAL